MQFDLNLAANGSQIIDAAGKFFKYVSGTGKIRVRASKGDYVDLLPGQGVWNQNFTSLIVQDRTGASNTGVLLAGDFDFHDDRISGTVDVVDGGKARTYSGACFMCGLSIAGVAGQISGLQIWNPVASGKNLIVEKISLSTGTIGLVDIGRISAAMANLNGSAVNKNLASATNSIAEMRQVSQVGLTFTGANIMWGAQMGVNTPLIVPVTEPIIVTPGRGLCVQNESANAFLAASFEWFEEVPA